MFTSATRLPVPAILGELNTKKYHTRFSLYSPAGALRYNHGGAGCHCICFFLHLHRAFPFEELVDGHGFWMRWNPLTRLQARQNHAPARTVE